MMRIGDIWNPYRIHKGSYWIHLSRIHIGYKKDTYWIHGKQVNLIRASTLRVDPGPSLHPTS